MSLLAALAATGLFAGAPPGSPRVDLVLPRGGARGADTTVTFHGERLADAAEVLWYDPGIEVLSLEAPDETKAVARLRIAADGPLGEHRLRLRTRTGISELCTFWVGTFPVVDEAEPNGDFDHLQPVGRNVTLHGTLTNEDVDCFVLEMKAGERLTAEVEGLRLADTLFDPFVALLDERRFELASCDDSSLFKQDPVASCVVPADGRYVVLLRESSYGGNDRCRYRLHVGTFPRPLVAFPAGGKTDTAVTVRLLGDVKGEIAQTVQARTGSPADNYIHVEQEGVPAPSGVPFRAGPFEPVAEVEPNETFEQATAATAGAPVAFDGVLERPGDVDVVRFPAKKDERVHLRLHGRSVRSPLDSVITVHAADGRQLEASDDTIGLDSYVNFNPPADGDYFVRVTDHLGAGGPTYVWRLAVAAFVPTLNVDIPRFGRDPQARQFAPVPRGSRYATVLHAGRGNFGGAVEVTAQNLPDGVKLTAVPMPRGLDQTLLLFEAAADAPLGGRLAELLAACADPVVHGRLRQKIDLVIAPPNETNFYDTTVDRLAVTVTEEAPFKLDVAPPKTPLVQNGVVSLQVQAQRREGFVAPIVVRMLWLPPGLGSQPTVTIPEGQNEIAYAINANGDAQPGTWQLAVLGEAESGRGVVFASSGLTPLAVAPPFLSLKLDLAAAEQGQRVPVAARIEGVTPFEGKATVLLHGLPAKCTAEPREIAAGDTSVVFDVATAPDTPVGKHTSLFCQINVPLNGEQVVHYLGGGGVLRIDPPAPQVVAAPEPPKPAEPVKPVEPEKPPEKPLSRLEQLRLEAKQRAEQATDGAPKGNER